MRGVTATSRKSPRSPCAPHIRLVATRNAQSEHLRNRIPVVRYSDERNCETTVRHSPAKPTRAQFAPTPARFGVATVIRYRQIHGSPILMRLGGRTAKVTRLAPTHTRMSRG